MSRLLGGVPNFLGALVLLIIGWILGGIFGRLTSRALRSLGFQDFSDRIGFSGFLQKAGVRRLDASGTMGRAMNWIIRLLFLQMAAEALGLIQITVILNRLIAFIPNIVVAAVIVLVAALLARLLQGLVRGSAGTLGAGNVDLLGAVAYWAIIGLGIILAMNQLNIAPVVVNTLFIGLVATLVIALGLSFGLGGREVAADITRRWAARAGETKSQAQQPPAYGGPAATAPTGGGE